MSKRNGVEHTRVAQVRLGDDSSLIVQAEYTPIGDLASVTPTHKSGESILDEITIWELCYVADTIDAILAVLPAGAADEIRGGAQ